MKNLITIIQIVISGLLVAAILLQQRGSGLSSVFGGEGGNVYRTRRGLEKILFYSTVILAVIFMALAFVGFLIH